MAQVVTYQTLIGQHITLCAQCALKPLDCLLVEVYHGKHDGDCDLCGPVPGGDTRRSIQESRKVEP